MPIRVRRRVKITNAACCDMAEDASKQIAALRPKDAKTLDEYCRVVGGAVDVLIGDHLPTAEDIRYENVAEKDRGTYTEYLGLVRNKEHGSELPTIFLHPKQWNKKVVIWADENGKAGLFSSDGSPTPEVRALLDAGTSVAGVDLLFQGEFNADGKAPDKARRVKNDRAFSGFTTGYNHPLFAQRVHDLLSIVAFARNHEQKPERIDLVGLDGAGAWVAAAATQAGPAIDRAAIDTAGFRFAKLTEIDDVNFLPGAVKYGDVPGLLSLAAPHACGWLAKEANRRKSSRPPTRPPASPRRSPATTAAKRKRPLEAVNWLLK